MNAIATAVQRHGSGQAGLARLLGVTPQAVNQWVSGTRPVPSRHVLAIESATGVSRHLLRPDVFGSADGEMRISRIGPQIDCRMSKRALRARLGLSTDKQLAKVLKLPTAQVEGWSEEGPLPALPEIQRLLGVQEQPQAQPAPHDPDENRYAPLEVA
ncbi:helix-turn-helix domain-containing protein [Stenotrophomonas maltophilia]|nr:helix-turn-helix domain-containing protein [Stenotrophomonas maltophilia]